MSEYGRIWESIQQVRDAIKVRVPAVRTDTLAQASEDVAAHQEELAVLLAEWRALEERAERSQ